MPKCYFIELFLRGYLSKGLNSYYIASAKWLVDVHAADRKMIMHCMHTSQIECVHFASMECQILLR